MIISLHTLHETTCFVTEPKMDNFWITIFLAENIHQKQWFRLECSQIEKTIVKFRCIFFSGID